MISCFFVILMQKTVPDIYLAACFALLGHCCWRKLLHHWMFLCMFLWFLVFFGEVAWWFLLCLLPLPAPVHVPVTLVASGSCFCSCGCHWFLFLLLLLCLLVLLPLLHFLDSWSVIAAGLAWVCLVVLVAVCFGCLWWMPNVLDTAWFSSSDFVAIL